MAFFIFHFTLVVLLVSILASATCLSSYLVSRNRTMLFACLVFLFYFCDVAWVFQDDLVKLEFGDIQNVTYLVFRSLTSILAGGGILISFWFLICDYIGKTDRKLLFIPGLVFVAGSVAALFLPESGLQRFVFYSMRALMLFWMLLYLAYYYFTLEDGVEKSRLKRHARLYGVWWILGIAVVVEDALCFLILGPADIYMGPRSHAPERCYSENLFVLVCAYVAIRSAISSLSLRFDRPLTKAGGGKEKLVDENLMYYGKRHHLSEREQEVLRFILEGKDNQNIASSMNLALSTVKVHVHNILQKTGQTNRQDVIRDFWKR